MLDKPKYVNNTDVSLEEVSNTFDEKFWYIKFKSKKLESKFKNDPDRFSNLFLNFFILTVTVCEIIIVAALFVLYAASETLELKDEFPLTLLCAVLFYMPCLIGNIVLRKDSLNGIQKQVVLGISIYLCFSILISFPYLYFSEAAFKLISSVIGPACIIGGILTRIFPSFIFFILTGVAATHAIILHINNVSFNSSSYFLTVILYFILTQISVLYSYYFFRKGFLESLLLGKQAELLAETNNTLNNLLKVDFTTKVGTRREMDRCFRAEWEDAVNKQSTLSVILIDVDYFKQYNDHFGHIKGDEALIKVAQCLNKIAARFSDLVMRYGGEEFVMILPNTPSENAYKLAGKVCEEIESMKISHPKSKIGDYLTVSTGVASILPEDKEVDFSVVSNADKALYFAKNLGRNQAYKYTNQG